MNAQLFIDGAICVICLLCREVEEQQFSRNFQEWIANVQNDFQIADSQIIALSIDPTKNMKWDDFISNLDVESDEEHEIKIKEINCFDDDPWIEIEDYEGKVAQDQEENESEPYEKLESGVRMLCVVHQLQLAVNAFLWKDKNNSRLITVAQKLIAKLRSPSVRSLIVEAKLKQAILDQKTRWSSTYSMIERLIELKDFCQAKAPQLQGLKISDKQWDSLKELLIVLKPIAQLTTRLQSEQLDVTQFVNFWKMTMFVLEQQKTPMACQLRALIRTRESIIFENRLIQAAIYLDKRYFFMMPHDKVLEAKAFIREIWKKRNNLQEKSVAGKADDENRFVFIKIEEISGEISTEENVENEMNEWENHLSSLESDNKMLKDANQKNLEDLELELALYDKLSRLQPGVEIMKFWKEQNQFTELQSIALDIISVPVKEVTVERMFSHLTFVLNRYRSTLKADLLEDIMFLRLNNEFDHSNKS